MTDPDDIIFQDHSNGRPAAFSRSGSGVNVITHGRRVPIPWATKLKG
jgi:hypothetical protein